MKKTSPEYKQERQSMMIEKLLNKYPNSISHKQDASNVEQYLWFRDDNGCEIGIPKSAITPEEINLLSLLFQTDSFDGRNDTSTKLTLE